MKKLVKNELKGEKNYFKNKTLNSKDSIIQISNRDLDDKNNNSNLSFNEENQMYLSANKNDNYLYGNDFSLILKPSKIGSTRVCLFINNYPIISIGKNILLPLLLIVLECLIYIFIWNYFFHSSGYLLKKLFNYCFLIYLISHILSIILNPGIPSVNYNKKIIKDLFN